MDSASNTSRTVENAIQGADNLLLECLGVKQGDSLLLVLEEDESLYERDVGRLVESRGRDLGVQVTVISAALVSDANEFPDSVSSKMRTVDHTLFLSRLGDYVRFVELPGECTKYTSYTYTTTQLGSLYARVSHNLLAKLLDKLEHELLNASTWQITCPLGTDVSGSFCWPSRQGGDDDELLVGLFPVSTFKPVPCYTASGTVALSRWLMPGGAPKIESPGMNLTGTVFCELTEGKIQRFYGPKEEATKVSQHYDRIASTLDINRNRVHSWHLGINPHTTFPEDPDSNLDKWSAFSFASPRYLHFHTCGDEPPGEIAWSLFNCSVLIDDQPYWNNRQFTWLTRSDNHALISQHPSAEVLFNESCPIGV